MVIPQKILTRKEEITADFMLLLEQHMSDILAGKTTKMHHIKDFANLLFIHPTHFSNTIKLTTGHSPCYFLEKRTIEEAKKMLSDDSLSIAQIAYQLTFDEPTNFTKFFKGMEGATPRQYREKLLNLTQ